MNWDVEHHQETLKSHINILAHYSTVKKNLNSLWKNDHYIARPLLYVVYLFVRSFHFKGLYIDFEQNILVIGPLRIYLLLLSINEFLRACLHMNHYKYPIFFAWHSTGKLSTSQMINSLFNKLIIWLADFCWASNVF